MARFYRDGIYVDRDYEKAAYWYAKTAEQGLAEGAYEIAKLHNKKLLKDSSADQENYWLDMAYQIDGDESGAAVIKKANELIIGADGNKDLDRGIQLLISAIIGDPTSTTELIIGFYKEKVINEDKFIEIINIIKSRSEKIYYKSSLMILYYQNLIKGEDNNKKFLELANEILESELEAYHLQHGIAYSYLASFYFDKGDFNKSEDALIIFLK